MLAAVLSLVLTRAEVAVAYVDRGACGVTLRVEAESKTPVSRESIAHTLSLGGGASLVTHAVTSEDGEVRSRVEGSSPVATLIVDFESPVPRGRFSYVISYRLAFEGFDCAVAVPPLHPVNPHGAVRLSVTLPPGEARRGPVFPNLDGDLRADLGAVPAYVRVPWGRAEGVFGLAPHLVDGMAVTFIVAATLVWRKTRGSE